MHVFIHDVKGHKYFNLHYSRCGQTREEILSEIQDLIDVHKKKIKVHDLSSITFALELKPPHIEIYRTCDVKLTSRGEVWPKKQKYIDTYRHDGYIRRDNDHLTSSSYNYLFDEATPEGLIRLWANDLIHDFNEGKSCKGIKNIQVFQVVEWISRFFFDRSIFLQGSADED